VIQVGDVRGIMTKPNSVHLSSTPSLEEVMAALAKNSIYDLPALGKEVVAAAQKQAEVENDPPVFNVIVWEGFVYGGGHQETLK